MKRFIEVILEHASIFLGNSRASKAIEPDSKEEIKNNIELALYKNASIHVIYGNRSFTGDIVKYDTERPTYYYEKFQAPGDQHYKSRRHPENYPCSRKV